MNSTVMDPDVAVRLCGLPTSGRICRRLHASNFIQKHRHPPQQLVVGWLVTIKNFELNLSRVVADLKSELFVPHRVDGVANDARHVVLRRLIDAQYTVRVAVRPEVAVGKSIGFDDFDDHSPCTLR